ncbi:MAG: type I-E CRISPR-associated protein Cse1/CasA, partial [Gammaproteobacteria bacterium]|nr:type I-E CRISPR-associated protein Cse1/CasA [Gammaproteobacteria bacterium]
ETIFPLYLLPVEYRSRFSERVETLITAATEAAGFVRGCVKDAWFKRPGDAKGDTSFLVESFFNHTQQDFLAALVQLEKTLVSGADGTVVLQKWHSVLRTEAIQLFDHWAGQESMEFANPRRIANAHQKLLNLLYSKKFKNLLHMPDKKEEAA